MTENQPMVRLAANKIANSFSRRKDLGDCPRLYYEKHIAKTLPFVETEATLLGTAAHDYLQKAVETGLKILDASEMQRLYSEKKQDFNPDLIHGSQRAFKYITAKTGLKMVEQQWALKMDKENQTFKPVPWMGKDVFDRAIADVVVLNDTECEVDDYKTGKAKYVHQNQLEDMAIHVFFRFPWVQRVQATFHMLAEPHDRDARVTRVYTRKDLEIRKRVMQWIEIDKEIRDRNQRMDWPDQPGTQCRWCDASDCGSHPSNAY